jgi:hypothetical protein
VINVIGRLKMKYDASEYVETKPIKDDKENK